ncbi:hypothetical protein OG216_19685 [Streptomycetaceae bacterium NBC_01309]
MTARTARKITVEHGPVATAAKAAPGVWKPVAVYPALTTAQGVVDRIHHAKWLPSYAPAGTFEAYHAPHEDGGTAVWVRYTVGAPAVEPRPTSMTYRVCDRGSGRGYVGVSIVTVVVSPDCPRCGGPRGEARSHWFPEDGAWYGVSRWDNACGHQDSYVAVLAEYRKLVAQLEAAERQYEARVDKHDLARLGEYADAVRLLLAFGAGTPGLHARQGALCLDMRAHHEAALRIQEELARRSGRMSVRNAAWFLAGLAAAPEAFGPRDVADA